MRQSDSDWAPSRLRDAWPHTNCEDSISHAMCRHQVMHQCCCMLCEGQLWLATPLALTLSMRCFYPWNGGLSAAAGYGWQCQ